MTPEFSQVVHPFFNMVLKLVEQGLVGSSIETERIQLIKELNRAESEVSKNESKNPMSSMKREHFLLAKRGLVYWADEVLTTKNTGWKDKSLEWEIYQTSLRAVLFYTEGVQEVMGSHPDVIEVWFLCLTLGFQGSIDEASQKINRPLPGGEEDPEKARVFWAGELHKLLENEQPVKPRGEPLRGELSNLDGHVMLPMAVGLLALSLSLLGGLYCLNEFVLKSGQVKEPPPIGESNLPEPDK